MNLYFNLLNYEDYRYIIIIFFKKYSFILFICFSKNKIDIEPKNVKVANRKS